MSGSTEATSATSATRAEVCAVAVAEAFRGDGEILASSFGTVPAVGARLARMTFEPDLLMTDGIATVLESVDPVSGPKPEPVYGAWMNFRTVFDVVWSGTRHVVMIASQIDRYGNQNFACSTTGSSICPAPSPATARTTR